MPSLRSTIHGTGSAQSHDPSPPPGSLPVDGRGALAPGALVAEKYRVERKLGEGGMGVIVLATHIHLKQRVAIKYLQDKVLGNAVVVERFRREAQLAASIRSAHVVRVYDVGALDNGAPYMVMEYLEGEDLGAVLGRGTLPVDVAVDYVMQACDAIAEAHAIGIVHRDLKPENLFLARRSGGGSIVKILDFGISKASVKRGADGARLPRMTEDGERFGTPVYMPPEQLLSSTNVDPRADIWALGVVLFELLTAELPFVGEEMTQLCASILSLPATPLREKCAGVSAELEAIILKCLEKDPARRYRNIAELAQELAPFGSPLSQHQLEGIKRIVREGGASIRPPQVVGVVTGGGIVREQPLPTRQAPSTVAEAFTLPIGATRPRTSPLLALLATLALVGAVTVSVSLAWVSRSQGNRSPAASTPVGLVAAPSPSFASELSNVAAGRPAPDEAPPARLTAPATAPVPLTRSQPLAGEARPTAPIVVVRRHVAVKPQASVAPHVPAQVPGDADARSADRSEFGERR
jgi:serine/threonine protein kinase